MTRCPVRSGSNRVAARLLASVTKENAVLSRGQGMRGRAGVGEDWVMLMNSVSPSLQG